MSSLASLLLILVTLAAQAASPRPVSPPVGPAPSQDADVEAAPPADRPTPESTDTALPDAALPEPRGRLLFTRQLNGRDDLFVLRLPEGRLEQLTDHAAKDSHGAVSPDARRIAFSSERRGWWKIWLMDAEGGGVEQLTRPASGADACRGTRALR